MTATVRRQLPRLLVLGAVAAAVAGALDAAPSRAATASTVSSNWAGYVASGSKRTFRRVSASWAVPAATCTGESTYSAVWVGLGGFRSSSQGLEQTGVDIDCTRSGRAVYRAWYELLPAGAVTIRMPIHAGDRMQASVSVTGQQVRLRVRDLTSGRSFARTVHMSHPDVSSADWIVEAPASCITSTRCRTLRLSDFGKVGVARASATDGDGHSGGISSSAWSSTKVTLGQSTANARFPGASGAGAGATPSALSSRDASFSVSYVAQPVTQGGGRPTTFPGSGPG